MPLEPETINTVDDYVTKHIADPTWHRNFFGFLSDPNLADRLSDEFMSARYIYKLLEGLEAVGWLQRAEVRVQLLLYASIYEAVLHHVLFVDLTNIHEVVEPHQATLAEAILHSCRQSCTTIGGAES